MKLQNWSIYSLAVMTLCLVGSVAQAQTITVLQRFDYPSNLNHHVQTAATLPQKVSDQGDVIGTVIDVNGKAQGFIYKFRLGKFSNPFSAPDDTGNDTQGRGINIHRHSCGEYLRASDDTFHGYLLVHPFFFNFDVSGAMDTIPLGINNDGSFVGTALFSDGTQPAFVSGLSATVDLFSVPGATATFAYQINATNQVMGYYVDANGTTHGFTRDSAGNLNFPIDVPGATGTILFGNNDENWGVGRYTDAEGSTHGLYFITFDNILTFDAPYPGATFTSLNGINKNGQVCGYYIDTAGASHGLMAQVEPNSGATWTPVRSVAAARSRDIKMPATSAKPFHAPTKIFKIAAPAS